MQHARTAIPGLVAFTTAPVRDERGTWLSFELDGERQNSIFIPPGRAHGHQTLTPVADTSYRIDRTHDAGEDLTIAWDDPELSIPWPLSVGAMSERDAGALPLSALATS